MSTLLGPPVSDVLSHFQSKELDSSISLFVMHQGSPGVRFTDSMRSVMMRHTNS